MQFLKTDSAYRIVNAVYVTLYSLKRFSCLLFQTERPRDAAPSCRVGSGKDLKLSRYIFHFGKKNLIYFRKNVFLPFLPVYKVRVYVQKSNEKDPNTEYTENQQTGDLKSFLDGP